jgi:hypothetical protein
MKKPTGRKRQEKTTGEMRVEYRFDYAKAKPNRFAGSIMSGSVTVILDPDVAAVFRSSDTVNALLCSVITTLPGRGPKRAKAG